MFKLRIPSSPISTITLAATLVFGLTGCTKHEQAPPNPASSAETAPEATQKAPGDVFLQGPLGVQFQLCPNDITLTTDASTGVINYTCGAVPGCPLPWVALKYPLNICFTPGQSYWMKAVGSPGPAMKFNFSGAYNDCSNYQAVRFTYNGSVWSVSGTTTNMDYSLTNEPCEP